MFVRTPRSVVLLTGETCLLLAAVVAGTFLRLGTLAVPALSDGGGILRVFLIVGVCQMCLHYADLYDLPSILNVGELLVRQFLADTGGIPPQPHMDASLESGRVRTIRGMNR